MNKVKPLVAMSNISKAFPSVQALDNVKFDLYPGEVHALVGENGAGKSTLIKILMGVYTKDAGRILIKDQEVEIKSPIHAKSLGLGAVYQDVNLAPHLSIAENFFMGNLLRNKLGVIDMKSMEHEVKKILDSIEVYVDPKRKIQELSVAEQAMVSIAKIMHLNSDVVIFDEPTALLTSEETEQLFKIIKKLKSQNKAVIYISHRLEEIFEISDRVSVFKDGTYVNTLSTCDTNEDELISMMVGRAITNMYDIQRHRQPEVVLRVENLTRQGVFHDINFDVHHQEIFGMFGLVGSGRTEIVRSIFGLELPDQGQVEYKNKKRSIKSPKQAINEGLALIPENRREQGLAMKLNLVDNTNVVAFNKVSKAGVLNMKKARATASKYIDLMGTKASSIYQQVKFLSGGNQQKVVISKWLAHDSELFFFDEPTVGVDVGSKVEIYKIFEDLIHEGKTIVIISSYLPELMGLSDRILVMHEGKQMGILNRDEFDEEDILRLASGLDSNKRN